MRGEKEREVLSEHAVPWAHEVPVAHRGREYLAAVDETVVIAFSGKTSLARY